MIPLVLDFETVYDKEGYSLRDMTTAEYVRDPRFRVLGVAVAAGDQVSWLEGGDVAPFLAAVPWDRTALVAHNASFDGAILAHLGHRPARYICTMYMLRYLIAQGRLPAEQRTALADAAHLVGKAKGDLDASLAAGDLDAYASMDAEICRDLWRKYAHLVPREEQDFIDLHVRMAAEPAFELDVPLLESLRDKDLAYEQLFPAVRQDETFARLLDRLGARPRYKTTAKGSYKLATAKTDGWLEELSRHPSEEVRLLAELRQKASSTIERSRSDRLLKTGAPLPVPLLYYGAHTGRSSGTDKLNLQNLKKAGDLRRAVLAPKGHRLVIVDSAQVEVRVLAWLAGQEDLLAAFTQGVDPYRLFGSRLYGVTPEEITPEQRQVAKAAVLALGFGQGSGGFLAYCERSGVPMDPAEAERTVAVYRQVHRAITAYWGRTFNELKTTGQLALPSGRVLTYPDLADEGGEFTFRRHSIFSKSRTTRDKVNVWRGLATENRVQAVARDVVFWQTRLLYRAGVPVLLMAHDESVLLAREDEAAGVAAAAEAAFATAPPWAPGLPVKGEVRITENYGK